MLKISSEKKIAEKMKAYLYPIRTFAVPRVINEFTNFHYSFLHFHSGSVSTQWMTFWYRSKLPIYQENLCLNWNCSDLLRLIWLLQFPTCRRQSILTRFLLAHSLEAASRDPIPQSQLFGHYSKSFWANQLLVVVHWKIKKKWKYFFNRFTSRIKLTLNQKVNARENNTK